MVTDLKLFKIHEGIAHELPSRSMALEKPLQMLVEENMEALFGFRFVASEYSTGRKHAGRIDSLAVDSSGCPVIFEYKRSTNQSVISQGLFYLDWLLDHSAEFESLVRRRLGADAAESINWNNPRLICVAGNFTRYDEHAVLQIGRRVELVRYRSYAGSYLSLELLTATDVDAARTTGSRSRTESFTQAYQRAGPALRELYDRVAHAIVDLGEDVTRRVLKHHVAFRAATTFAWVEIRPDPGTVVAYLSVDLDHVQLIAGFTRDVTGSSRRKRQPRAHPGLIRGPRTGRTHPRGQLPPPRSVTCRPDTGPGPAFRVRSCRPCQAGLMLIATAEYARLGAIEIAAAIRRRDLSAIEVTEAALRCVEATDAEVRAFTVTWRQRARRAAGTVDALIRDGEPLPLAGVPLGVKATEGLDAFQTARLVAAGCVPVGLTSTPGGGTTWRTWGWTDRGPTRNPWRLDRSPGGSSAGSAAAVAAGMVPLATGSDGAGSVRIPAAWCGIVGMKPTNGRFPARDAAGLNAPGPLARTAEDAAAYLEALEGRAAEPPGTLTERPRRVAWSPDLGFAAIDDQTAAVAARALETLIDAEVMVPKDVPVELSDPAPAWLALRADQNIVSREAYRLLARNESALASAFSAVDLLVTPTTPNGPHHHDGPGAAMSVALTWAFNLSGHPAVTIPAGWLPDGCPAGLQLVGRLGADDALLRVATSSLIALDRVHRPATRSRPGVHPGPPAG